MNINKYKVTFLLYQLLIFLNLFIVHLFRQRDCKKKKFLSAGGTWLFFISPGQWIGNEQLFKVGLNNISTSDGLTWSAEVSTISIIWIIDNTVNVMWSLAEYTYAECIFIYSVLPFFCRGAWKTFSVGKKGGTCTSWIFRGEWVKWGRGWTFLGGGGGA